MAPFGTYNTFTKPVIHPRARLGLAAAAIGGHEIAIPEDFTFGVTNKTPEYLAKFPLGKMPTFEGADGFCLSETNAIALYIADTAPKPGKREQLLGATAHERALVQQWLWFTYQHLEPTMTTLCLWRFGPWATYDKEKEEKADGELRRWLVYIEKSVRDRGDKWLAGTEAPSIADLAVCGQLYNGFMVYVDAEMRKEFPVAVKFYKRLLDTVPEVKELYSIENGWVETRKQPETSA
ncbi:glutathione S-transferase [Echria macrotheca]|uniref:Glutathione S-transferase n=1 Tax=Echria macrotheca TaxID=438768 RepID=A0AAJ0F250_9PEZI|nr:glutathione S-transferase [Echria macrotheca]